MDDGKTGFEGAEQFTRLWTDFASKMAAAGMSYTPDQAPPEASRAMRDAMLGAMGEACDQYMRSPEFLGVMRTSMQEAIALRKQLNDFLGQMQHEMQGASRQDMDQLMQALSHIEKRVVNGLERLTERVDDLSDRLDRIEQGGTAPAPKRTTRATKATKKKAAKKTKKTKTKRTTRKKR